MKGSKILAALLLIICCTTHTIAQTVTAHSDATWKTSTTLQANWNQPSFNDASWSYSIVSPTSTTSCTGYATPGGNTSTLGTLMWSGSAANTNSYQYFRKHIMLTSVTGLTAGYISITADDLCQLYVNGTAIGSTVGAVANGVVTYNLATIKPYLVCGDNVIALQAEDTYGYCWWAYLDASFTGGLCGIPSATCTTANIVPRIDPANTNNLTCSEIYDNGTKVGIGTTSPGAKLDIQRPATVSEAVSTALNVHNADKSNTGFTSGSAIIGLADNNNTAFANGGVSGIANNAALNTGVMGTAQGTTGSANYGVWGNATGVTTNYAIVGQTSGTHPSNCAGYFSGDVVTTTNYFTTSDERLKTNIATFKGALELLKNIPVKSYDFKVEEMKDVMTLPDGHQIGIMAQDLQKVLPGLVREKVTPAHLDPETGQLKGKATTFLAVNYTALVPVLVEAVNDLNTKTAEIARLNDKISQLQSQVNDLCSSGCASLISPAADQGQNSLQQNVPNPFTQQTSIGYAFNVGTTGSIVIYGMDGKELSHSEIHKGIGSVSFAVGDLAAGAYIYSLVVDGKNSDSRIMVITSQK